MEETIVQEVLCSPRQLRSRACILLIHGHKMQLGLWKGCKSTNNTQNIARNVCNKLQANPCSELFKDKNITFTEYDEGTEPASFFEVLGGNDRSAYNSLLKAKETFEFTPRLYEFTSKNGSFEANEVISNMRTSDHPTMFPFIQEG